MSTDADALTFDGALWRYALAFYAKEGVADACLHLQDDSGVDVVELIFALYAGAVLRLPIDRALLIEARAAVGSWRQDSVLPLRDIRRRLKVARTDCPESVKEELRRQVKQAELRAEQIQLALLERWVSGRTATGSDQRVGIAGVVELVLSLSNETRSARSSDAARVIIAAAASMPSASGPPGSRPPT